MSYAITIRADETFSQLVSYETVREIISRLPGVEPNGSYHFALNIEDRLWMEIYLEWVSTDGDLREDFGLSSMVNCIRLHIPYGWLGESPEHDYFPTAVAIANHLGWEARDEQTGRALITTPAN